MDIANIFAMVFDINGSVFWARGFKKKEKGKKLFMVFAILWCALSKVFTRK